MGWSTVSPVVWFSHSWPLGTPLIANGSREVVGERVLLRLFFKPRRQIEKQLRNGAGVKSMKNTALLYVFN